MFTVFVQIEMPGQYKFSLCGFDNDSKTFRGSCRLRHYSTYNIARKIIPNLKQTIQMQTKNEISPNTFYLSKVCIFIGIKFQ